MIAVACDLGAFKLKEAVKRHLEARGFAYRDFGAMRPEPCDYPDFAGPAAQAVGSGGCERGIVLCTTGIGVSMTANKIRGVRCALLSDLMCARTAREKIDINMMALGAGVVGEEMALELVDVFLDTPFEGGRHARRVEKLMAYEEA